MQTMQDLNSVQDLCCAINDRASRLSADASALRERRLAALAQISQSGASAGFIPSGPRKRGEGCDDENQGIVAADETSSGGARLRVTLLAAGFIIGPGGMSIRAVSHMSGADIRSWSETFSVGGRARRVRTIVMEGHQRSVVAALGTVVDAVERYKQLCEGKYCGKLVDRVQVIRGVEFFYSPPPRSAVPYAAALKPEGGGGGGPAAQGPPLNLPISPGATASIAGKISSGLVSPTAIEQKENAAAAAAASPGVKPVGAPSPRKPTFASITESHLNARVFDPLGVALPAAELEGGAPAVYGGESLDLGGGGLVFRDAGSALAAALGVAEALLGPSLSGYSAVPPPPPQPLGDMSMAAMGAFFPGAGGSFLHGGSFLPSYGAPAPPGPGPAGPLFGTMPGPLAFKPPPPAAPHPSDLAAAVVAEQDPAPEPLPRTYTLFGPDAAPYPFGPALLTGIWGAGGGGDATASAEQAPVGDNQLRAEVFGGYDPFSTGVPFYGGAAGAGAGAEELAAARRPAFPVTTNVQGLLRSAFEEEGQE